jgi:hypothetical protein
VPGVEHLESRELVDVRVHDRGERTQQASPLTGSEVTPGREGGLRPLDGLVRGGDVGKCHLADRLGGCRVDDGVVTTGG